MTPSREFRTCLHVLLMFSVSCQANNQEAVISPQGAVHIDQEDAPVYRYGADASWPMQHEPIMIDPTESPLSGRKEAYLRYMAGCLQHSRKCPQYEQDRIEMNLLQPSAMQNYTSAGYAKVRAPQIVQELLSDVWQQQQQQQQQQQSELWDSGNVYVNHWEAPTKMLDISHPELGLSEERRWQIVKQVQSVLEAWTQQPLVLTSLYGIRVYQQGAILVPHVDRLPLVSSAIINVAQDVDEPWILEVIGHDGQARNITMVPGDMVLYESHSVIHGRPYPLQGNHFANVFVHFEPLGHTMRHMQQGAYGSDVTLPERAKNSYEQALHREQHTPPHHIPSPDLPPYVQPDQEVRWKQQYDYEKEMEISPKPTRVTLGQITVHHAASDGMLDVLKEFAKTDRSQLFKADQNGWRPLHEAARGGRHEVIEYLLAEGAQVNERTNNGQGGNALFLALKQPRHNAKAIEVLKKYGGVSLPPNSMEKGSKKKN